MGNKGAKVLTLLNGKFNVITVHIFVVHAVHKCHKVNVFKSLLNPLRRCENFSCIAQLCTNKHRTASMCENILQH